ncbi:MAG: hypothetical protein CMM91_06205 [Rickettsiales bacterium]|nr:hypothetical protein [Rickettsiales bacterium]OUV53393.1 MAG: hypothetical protein CBC87_04185 [Rickettsiales bacterium TMED127]|tara:strand:- start:45134 stop:46537 length:1404 start_codon:yes stop_codon:yes gene_type:complete
MNILKKYKSLISILEDNEYSIDKQIVSKYCIDWRKDYEGTSEIILFPKSVEKISKIVSICSKKKIPIVPQGGNTGLVGGSVPRKNKGEIILNLKNLNKIRNLSSLDYSLIVESGCILQSIHDHLKKKSLLFPVSMGSRGSCQIGGNIATNAGGVNVIKFGSLRSNIIGLEAVMNNGQIFSQLNNIKKNNTGYDLKQLLIGSEGTLGIITAANFKIYPSSLNNKVIFASFKCFNSLMDFYFNITKTFSSSISSFEYINQESMNIVLKHYPKLGKIFNEQNCYCLIEVSNYNAIPNFDNYVICNVHKFSSIAEDIIISKSESENIKIWQYRELIPLAETKEGFCIKHDISIPLESMEKFIDKTMFEIKKIEQNVRLVNFGHLGDNNLHFNIMYITKENSKKLIKNSRKINNIIYEKVKQYQGSFSAEHGIGQLKKKQLKIYKSKLEYSKMKAIKKIFDPNNIFNPGKVI